MQAKELIKWRKSNNYTSTELAQVLNTTYTTIYRWEHELRAIPPFLALTLECLEKKGGEQKPKGKKKKKEVSK